MGSWFSIHNHSVFSNLRLRDAVNDPKAIIQEAIKKDLSGIVLSDHETLSGTVKFWEAFKKLEKDGEIPEGFTIGSGNEIYLIDRDKEELMIAQQKVKYNHFLLVAKNQKGFEFLKEQSSKAWENRIHSRGMERVPTFKDDLSEMMKNNKGDIIASTACIGGELPQLILQLDSELNISGEENEKTKEIRKEIHIFVKYLIDTFGKEDVYFELQPSKFDEQLIVNKWLPKLSAAYGIKCIVTTDAHYLNKDQAEFHKQYLTSSEGEREVEAFYSTTYIFSKDELLEYFESDFLEDMMRNTKEIQAKLEPLTFAQETKIPIAHIPDYKFDNSIMAKIDSEKYPHIYEMMNSNNDIDRYYHYLNFIGFIDKNQEFNDENLSRIDLEYSELIAISYQLGQPMTSYFVLMKEFVDIMWEVSLVGVSRGSAACYYTNYLLDIVQLNPIKYDLPYWRFLSREYVGEFPDIDVDAEGSKRAQIVKLVKERYGEDSVLNIGTFTTEGARAATLTACRSIGLDPDTAQNIANTIPQEKGQAWDLHDAFLGNDKKHRNPSKELINEVNQYPGLQDIMLQSQGIVSGRGQHASGIVVFPNGYVAQNAMMETTSGLPITQFDAGDTEFMGGLKYDFLSINALDRIRTAIDLMLETGKIEWQGTLRNTFKKYFHPDVLNLEDPLMYKMLYDGEIISAFQFETDTGRKTLEKIHAMNFEEINAANSLMRLTSDGEQPIDKFVRYKNDINEWEKDMDEYSLVEDEKVILRDILASRYGVCDTQELLMQLAMDKRTADFNLREGKMLRKASAKKDPKIQKKQKIIFFEKGKENGSSENLLNYIWNECFVPTFGYSFSAPHVVGYSMILMIEMNISRYFGSIFWKTACLTVDSGIVGEGEKGTNYGKLAKSLERFKDEITPPSYAKSRIGFYPDLKNNKIIYGLKPMTNINATLAQQIIDNRPYSSLDDFIIKNIENGDLTEKKMIVLIKSGMFDEFSKDRKQIMFDFVCRVVPLKQKLTSVVLPKIADKIPEEHKDALTAYMFQKSIKKEKTHDNFSEYYLKNYHEEAKKRVTKKYSEDYYYDDNGKFVIELKVFEKLVKDKSEDLKEWLNSEEALKAEAALRRKEFWIDNCIGSISKWEMESISFYITDHELNDYPLEKFFEISKFEELESEPVVDKFRTGKNGRKFPVYQTNVIAGTVVDTIPAKGLLTVITQYGVVSVRVGKGKFQHYHKKIMIGEEKNRKCVDDSWFKRGNKLVFVGYRRESEFYCNANNSGYQHSVMLITGKDENNVFVQQEKKKFKDY